MFFNVNLSNLENILQKNLRTKRARGCIFWAFGCTNFEPWPWWHLCGFDVCTSLSKKNWMCHWCKRMDIKIMSSPFILQSKYCYPGICPQNWFVTQKFTLVMQYNHLRIHSNGNIIEDLWFRDFVCLENLPSLLVIQDFAPEIMCFKKQRVSIEFCFHFNIHNVSQYHTFWCQTCYLNISPAIHILVNVDN